MVRSRVRAFVRSVGDLLVCFVFLVRCLFACGWLLVFVCLLECVIVCVFVRMVSCVSLFVYVLLTCSFVRFFGYVFVFVFGCLFVCLCVCSFG